MASNKCYVQASRHDVFAVLSDGWAYSNWVVGTSHVRAVERDWPAVGSKIYHASGVWPLITRDETEVLACEQDVAVVLRARGRPFGEAEIAISLADDGDGCMVTLRETPCAGPARWFHNPGSEVVLVRRNTETLARLAAVVERPIAPAQ